MNTEVQEFYDAFRDQRMVGYRIDGSRRIQAAVKFAAQHLQSKDIIADVGCGIGIFSEKIGQKFPNSKIIGMDVSESNIDYAKKTVSIPNVIFCAASATEQFAILRKLAGRQIDAFCLIDVVEHIPEDARPQVLKDMADAASGSAVLVLAYPSPEYQRHLMAENQEELQIIDNVVEIAALIRETELAGWQLKEFRYVDMWMTNQYIHAAFAKRLDLATVTKRMSIAMRVRHFLDRAFLRPRRVRRYGRV
jgi:2-polyprenyl-3-methyl-5-hydroxy-6-metoxy-1,4-benzoquinol methylase